MGLISLNKLLLRDKGIHLIIGLKYISTQLTSKQGIIAAQTILTSWELGRAIKLSVLAWKENTKIISGQRVYIGRRLFSSQLSLLLILILIIILLY